jgi:aspartate-semialdehyde dehydrogenase
LAFSALLPNASQEIDPKFASAGIPVVRGFRPSPGVPSMAIVDNMIPFIGKEEKVESETPKIFGSVADGEIVPSRMGIRRSILPSINSYAIPNPRSLEPSRIYINSRES